MSASGGAALSPEVLGCEDGNTPDKDSPPSDDCGSESNDVGSSNEPDLTAQNEEEKSSPVNNSADDVAANDKNLEEVQLQQEHHPSLQPPLHPGSFDSYQHNPQPPPPPPPNLNGAGGYDVQAMAYQQQAALAQQEAAGAASPYMRSVGSGMTTLPPLSPTHTATTTSNIIPASPLFTAPSQGTYAGTPLTRLDSPAISRMAESSMASPLSPMPYLTPQAVPGSPIIQGYSVYQVGYGGAAATYQNPNQDPPASPVSPEHAGKTWPEAAPSVPQQQHHPGFQQDPKSSPIHQPHLIQYPQTGASPAALTQRSRSFDEILPPPAVGGQDPKHGSYSHGISVQSGLVGQGAGGAVGAVFGQPQPWGGYGAGGPLGHQQHRSWHGGNGHRHGGHFAGGHVGPPLGSPGHHTSGHAFFSTPGPPIQTSPSNKGPDGANLFIFHIPNHFTNRDMYNLFCHYGNLLSVRIMVEKETGRSRGFGFVSYDSPESAAMAIKNLNGFVIGNKRLKVQHKQIRPSEQTGQMHQGYHQPSSVPSQRRGDVHNDLTNAQSGAIGMEGRTTAPMPGWYNTQTSDLASDGSHASAPQHSSVEAPSHSGAQYLHSKMTDAATPIQHGSLAESKSKSRMAKIGTGKDMAISVSESTDCRSDNPRAALSPFPGTASESAPECSKSPLGQLESIRGALPDVSK